MVEPINKSWVQLLIDHQHSNNTSSIHKELEPDQKNSQVLRFGPGSEIFAHVASSIHDQSLQLMLLAEKKSVDGYPMTYNLFQPF